MAAGRTRPPGRRVLVQRPVRPMRIVVIDILTGDQPQVPFAGDQHLVQALAAGTGDPAFGYRVRPRRPDGRLDNLHADRGEHRVERRGELRIPVADQELQAISAALEGHQQVAGLLGHPRAGRVRGDPGQVHAAGAVLDEEQHVQAPQEHRAGVEKADGEDRGGLPSQERSPGQASPSGRGVDARVLEDLPYRRRREFAAEAGQLAVDAAVTPGRLSRAISSTSAQGLRRARPPGSAARVGPAAPDQAGVPAQQRPR